MRGDEVNKGLEQERPKRLRRGAANPEKWVRLPPPAPKGGAAEWLATGFEIRGAVMSRRGSSPPSSATVLTLASSWAILASQSHARWVEKARATGSGLRHMPGALPSWIDLGSTNKIHFVNGFNRPQAPYP